MYIYCSGCMEVYRRNITHAHIILHINRLTSSSYYIIYILLQPREVSEFFIRKDKKKVLVYECSRVRCIAAVSGGTSAAIPLYQTPARYSGNW